MTCTCTSFDRLAGNFCDACQEKVVEELIPSVTALEQERRMIGDNIRQYHEDNARKALERGYEETLNKGHYHA